MSVKIIQDEFSNSVSCLLKYLMKLYVIHDMTYKHVFENSSPKFYFVRVEKFMLLFDFEK
jgi:hypothetical protein